MRSIVIVRLGMKGWVGENPRLIRVWCCFWFFGSTRKYRRRNFVIIVLMSLKLSISGL